MINANLSRRWRRGHRYASALAGEFNQLILGPLLIFGIGPFPKLGVVGAAIATNIGRGTGALVALSRLARPGGRFSIYRHHLRLEPAIMESC